MHLFWTSLIIHKSVRWHFLQQSFFGLPAFKVLRLVHYGKLPFFNPKAMGLVLLTKLTIRKIPGKIYDRACPQTDRLIPKPEKETKNFWSLKNLTGVDKETFKVPFPHYLIKWGGRRHGLGRAGRPRKGGPVKWQDGLVVISPLSGSESGSGSISQRQGSADPDPKPDLHQNVMNPQHWLLPDQMIDLLRLVEVAEVVIAVELLGLFGLGLFAPLAMREAVRALQVQQLTQLIHQSAEHPNLRSSE